MRGIAMCFKMLYKVTIPKIQLNILHSNDKYAENKSL